MYISNRRLVCLYIQHDDRGDFMLAGQEAMAIGSIKAMLHVCTGIPPDQQLLTLTHGIGVHIVHNPDNAQTLADLDIRSLVQILLRDAADSVRARLDFME